MFVWILSKEALKCVGFLGKLLLRDAFDFINLYVFIAVIASLTASILYLICEETSLLGYSDALKYPIAITRYIANDCYYCCPTSAVKRGRTSNKS